MYCENCYKIIERKIPYNDFTVLCAECRDKEETKIEENFADKIEGYIDRISRGLKPIEDEDE